MNNAIASRPRRTGYLAEVEKYGKRQTGKVMAYSLDGARNVLVAQGYIVHRIGKPAEFMANGERQGFTLIPDAVREAKEFFGLKMPVKIRYSGRQGGVNGSHRVNREVTHHEILLKSYLSAAEASRVLWHELTHAMQVERLMANMPAGTTPEQVLRARRVAYSNGRTKYDRKPWEVEAREHEVMHDTLALAR